VAISITDKERAVMASAVRLTVDRLRDGKFAVDVVVGSSASHATSKISSIYKRHGTILHKALGVAISTDPNWSAWHELPLSHKSFPNGLNIDLVLYDGNILRILEVKRGLGKHDSDAKKSISKRLKAAESKSSQIFSRCKIKPVNYVECSVVSYYGKHAKAAGFKQLTKDALEQEFAGISSFIQEVDEYLRFRLARETVGDFLGALRELEIEVSAEVDGAVARRKIQSHPWDALGA
jgi:hypothetical protein